MHADLQFLGIHVLKGSLKPLFVRKENCSKSGRSPETWEQLICRRTLWKCLLHSAGFPEHVHHRIRLFKIPHPSANEQELYEQIGRLKMEVEWLKKKSLTLDVL